MCWFLTYSNPEGEKFQISSLSWIQAWFRSQCHCSLLLSNQPVCSKKNGMNEKTHSDFEVRVPESNDAL